jgi:hypothetical protein
MTLQSLVSDAQKYFPKIQIKYKSESWLMKALSYLLFFKKDFMQDCMTIGQTIYFPSQHFVKLHPVTSIVLFLYELVHIKYSELDSCLSSLYVIWKLSQEKNFIPHLDVEIKGFINQLQGVWHNSNDLEQQFKISSQKIQTGQRPFSDPIFDILDDLITKA